MKPILAGFILICAAAWFVAFSATRVTYGSDNYAAPAGKDAVFTGDVPGTVNPSTDPGIIEEMKNKRIANPVVLAGDPYLAGKKRVIDPPGDHTSTGAVCGMRYLDEGRKIYEIQTMRDRDEAARSGYTVTHGGYCGTCSTLQDLAVYLQRRDLTYAVRSCSFKMTRGPILSCLEKIGFSPQCALTWYYNIRNTGRQCLGVCLVSWLRREPLNRPDGSLNRCLQCDEDRSGPIFKYWAGRTRRNSGIRSEIERRTDEVYPLRHDYY
ncbi:MAG TPA: hypothetical protein PK307_12040 [Spirochaetota bacterium]|nr:hypothetical protein [Spirochaetota bacterium]HOD15351.1 hypothetical protein [Spirochaetota bacterium]HPN11770.1 hypothetical protein [Spirochaetota bacterium]HQL82926.1 hypothetical protein [Spirochaetota bacterium]